LESRGFPKSQYSVGLLGSEITEHGKPASILSDHGTTFYSMESERREKGMTESEKCLSIEAQNKIHPGKGEPSSNQRYDREVL
jgi:hypothetical protein